MCSSLLKIVLITIIFTTLLQCGNRVSGGSSDTEVSAGLSGFVVDAAGNPVMGATVKVRPVDYLPSLTDEETSAMGGKYDCKTDAAGFFTVDSVTDGIYCVEIRNGDSAGIIDIVTIDSTVMISPKLAPLGIITGNVNITDGSFSNSSTTMSAQQRSKVEVFGTDIVTYPDSIGHFLFTIPSGTHRMWISSDSSNIKEMIFKIHLLPAQYCDIGTLNFTKASTTCMDWECDSLTLRTFLNENGHQEITVEEVTKREHDRIYLLNLRGIKLTTPLAPLGLLNAVDILDLGNTGITDSCKFIKNMWNIQELELDSNAITGLSRVIEGAVRLRLLNVSQNNLINLPEKIYTIRPTMYLNLSGNKLCGLSPEIEMWADTYDVNWREKQDCPVQ